VHRHAAELHGIAGHVLEVLGARRRSTGTPLRRRRHRSGSVAGRWRAFTAFFGEDVPLALLAPAIADGALRRDQLAAFVEGDGFPFRVVVLAEVAGEVRGAQEAVGLEAGAGAKPVIGLSITSTGKSVKRWRSR
jgi:hypothetical protein